MIAHERLGRGEPLVLIHGLGSNRHVWRPVVPHLSHDRDLIAVDLPGFGDSAPLSDGPPTVAALATCVAALLDELGLESAHVAGNSLGGWVAVELARRRRARSLVLLSPAGLWRDRAPLRPRVLLRANRALAGALPGLTGALRSPVGRTALLWPFFGRPWRVPAEDAVAASLSFGTCPGFLPTYRELEGARLADARTVDVPVTVAFGARDRVLPRGAAQYPVALPRGVRRLSLRGCGHVPTYDDPELVAAVLLAGTQRQV